MGGKVLSEAGPDLGWFHVGWKAWNHLRSCLSCSITLELGGDSGSSRDHKLLPTSIPISTLLFSFFLLCHDLVRTRGNLKDVQNSMFITYFTTTLHFVRASCMYETSLADSSPVKQCVLPTFLIASRKNRRNLFTGFLHNIQTSGAAGSGWCSWGREDTSRTIRQLRNGSQKGISPNMVTSPVTVASAPAQTRQLPHAPNCPPWAFLEWLFFSDAAFSPLSFKISLKKPVLTIRGTISPITVPYLCANFPKGRAVIKIVKHIIYACAA